MIYNIYKVKELILNEFEKVHKSLSEKEIAIRRHGHFFDLEGLALAHLFDREKHLVDPFVWPDGHNVCVAIDPHPAKNHVAVMLGADRANNLFYLKELSSGAPPRQFARELKDWMKGFRVIDIVSDSLGATPGSGGDGNKTFIDVTLTHTRITIHTIF